jgi:hypothetical protein
MACSRSSMSREHPHCGEQSCKEGPTRSNTHPSGQPGKGCSVSARLYGTNRVDDSYLALIQVFAIATPAMASFP